MHTRVPWILLLLSCQIEDGIDPGEEPPEAATWDAAALGASADEARITADISTLAAFGTRHTATDGDDQARDWIAGRFEELGWDVEIDDFDADGVPSANVIARQDGRSSPERIWVFQAHYDSTSEMPLDAAPGADDNASGVAAVLEAARLLAGKATRDSVWLVATGAEEQGSLGSAHLVERGQSEGWDVQGVVAPDMVGYWPGGEDDSVDILGDEDSEWLVDAAADLADRMGLAHRRWVDHTFCFGDDHTNWQEGGFPAISPMDCVEAHNGGPGHDEMDPEQIPHYHRSSDTLQTLHMGFTTRVSGWMIATVAELAGPVGE